MKLIILLTSNSEEQQLTIFVFMSDCGCLYWRKQESEGRDDVQMVEASTGKEVEVDNALPSPPKHRPSAEKRKRVTEVQKLEISEGSQKILSTEKGTNGVRRRREKESSDQSEQPVVFKEPCIPQERKARGKGPKQKKPRCQAVLASDCKEDKAGAHQDINSPKVSAPTHYHSDLH